MFQIKSDESSKLYENKKLFVKILRNKLMGYQNSEPYHDMYMLVRFNMCMVRLRTYRPVL
jgi:hypothetical protein